MDQQTCKNCGNEFTGTYCNRCGEKVYTDHDKSMGHFLHETFHFFTHLDNKFFKTIALIFKKPGVLTVTYCNGVRNKYFKPVSLFFIGVILYLLFPVLPGLNMSFANNMNNLEAQHMKFFSQLAVSKAAAKNISLESLGEIYNHKSPAIAKIMLLILLPLIAWVIKLLFLKKKTYFFDYFILATEACCVFLYLNFLILPLILYIPAYISEYYQLTNVKLLGDMVTLPISAIYTLFWTTKSFSLFFNVSKPKAFGKGLLFLFLQSVVIFIIYRVILFLTVLLFI